MHNLRTLYELYVLSLCDLLITGFRKMKSIRLLLQNFLKIANMFLS